MSKNQAKNKPMISKEQAKDKLTKGVKHRLYQEAEVNFFMAIDSIAQAAIVDKLFDESETKGMAKDPEIINDITKKVYSLLDITLRNYFENGGEKNENFKNGGETAKRTKQARS